jgi:D5 N terminal like/Zinc-binding domain of primase-helicase
MMDAAFEAWVERARSVPIAREVERRGIKLRGRTECVGPCPRCGGVDRFAINVKKGVWNCRRCGVGGDVIRLVEHLDGVEFIAACETLTGEPPPKANGKTNDATARKVVAEQYRYETENGTLAFVVERTEYQLPDGSFVVKKGGKRKKSFPRKRPDPDRPDAWIWNVDGAPVVPYRLPQITEAIANRYAILIVEGERKADLLWSWNIPATCCAGGAKKWLPEHAEYLRNADVVILPDNDVAGHEHVDAVAATLQGVATSVRTLNLPKLSPKGDICDWAAAGGTVEQLHDLIAREARPWTPSDDEPDVRTPEQSDDALALIFAERYAADLRYVAFRRRWLIWQACRWMLDETLRVFDCARVICREQAVQCDNQRAASALASAKTVASVERLAKADRRIAAVTEQFDANPDIINSPPQTDPDP